MTSLRIGQGFDAHRFGDGEHIILGGVTIPYDKGLVAHSDGDVLLHALCDALLGALALGDIGQHFPDTSEEFGGIDSRILLRHVAMLISKQHYHLVNADITIVAQAPKMAPHLLQMRNNISVDLGVDVNTISIKATTTEKMGFTGRGEGIAAMATVLLDSTT